ncbi:DUF502 domain-containing protein [Paracoccus sp. M683]|uniref:DUF502 domain-containing protein n=1 Tax=Paracoccus sp. M683 TaxID=2594268 RepID=UPI00117F49DB|nr:DUF502 domain-containing protein [Paracoccus sp. M683]TRW97673.1 DUF502 domain-containing protein [Paracoccus sp. M683]
MARRKRPDPLNLQPQPHRKPGLMAGLRASFLTGLVVILPIAVTFWLIWTLMGWIDSWVLPMVPAGWRPEHYIGINLRGVGVIFFFVFTVLIGWIAKGFLGRSLLRFGERVVDRMPIVRSVYGGVKQIAETIVAQNESRFDHACLVEYPRKGMWGIGFVAGPAKGEIAHGSERPLLAVFVPTTPNPTSGFLLYVPEDDVEFLDMSIEDAAKLIISAGLVYPSARKAITPENSPAKSTES